MKQTLSFEGPSEPNHVYKLNKALNGLKQAHRAWYKRVTSLSLKAMYEEK